MFTSELECLHQKRNVYVRKKAFTPEEKCSHQRGDSLHQKRNVYARKGKQRRRGPITARADMFSLDEDCLHQERNVYMKWRKFIWEEHILHQMESVYIKSRSYASEEKKCFNCAGILFRAKIYRNSDNMAFTKHTSTHYYNYLHHPSIKWRKKKVITSARTLKTCKHLRPLPF